MADRTRTSDATGVSGALTHRRALLQHSLKTGEDPRMTCAAQAEVSSDDRHARVVKERLAVVETLAN